MTPHLIEIEARLDAATGPDRELDVAICRTLGLKVFPEDPPGRDTLGDAPRVTASLLAAVALIEAVLGDWWWTAGKCKLTAHASCGPDREGRDARLLRLAIFDQGFHADLKHGTPAIALCQATVKAFRFRLRHARANDAAAR